NVMIDGRGKARITDFGLAGLAGDFQGHEVRAGTPAYMAPEQLAGREVTAKSDIYSLGLVLYEIFTGKKAFDAATLEDLIKQRETTTPPSLSDYVKEIDPLVERVILRCLERDPQSRPSSVTQVAAALPGGDPLAAAIAAGETPSPEMVAAAPKEGALKPAVAVSLLVSILVVLGFLILFSDTVKMVNILPLEKSPEILAERASSIVKKLGYESPPVDKAYGFGLNESYLKYVDEHGMSSNLRERLASGRPIVAYFWYRQSPRYLETLGDNKVWSSDPPMDVSGMASVYLDTRGRLAEFQAVPPQVDDKQGVASAVDWSSLFAEAELDIASFKQTESTWVPPTGYDTRVAWEGVYPDQPDTPIRVEAAAYRGKPVYFQIIAPWERPSRQVPFQLTSGRKVAGMILAATFFAGVMGAVLIARRNMRLGRGDSKGAFKIALFVFSLAMLGSLIAADHVPTLGGELDVLYKAAAWALFLSALMWVIYIALEPYIRRHWPRLIISWSRLLAGGYRDPMVGRDIMVGGLLGMGHTVAIYFMNQIPGWLGTPGLPNPSGDPNIYGVQALLSNFINDSVVRSIFFGLGFMFLLLLFYALLRRQWLAALVVWLIHVAVLGFAFAGSGSWVLWIGPVMIATLYIIAAMRFGLLAMISAQLFFDFSFHYPITDDFSAWYSGATIFVLITLIGLAVYGFYTSLAGQPLFRGQILQD
ncbi:MAG TPA: serine/threonine-protein kinase, partial [Blastocatellia bacterium]|nr:serine/threonine-protein kinase [Blastocatellia bacterium]